MEKTVVPTAGRRDCSAGVLMVESVVLVRSFYREGELCLGPRFRQHDAEQAGLRGLAAEFQQGLVLGDQDPGAGVARDLEEFLVVAVGADRQADRFAVRRHHDDQVVETLRGLAPRLLVERQVRVVQHDQVFVAAVGAGDRLDLAGLERVQQPFPARVAKDEQVQADVGVENNALFGSRYHIGT